jgi:hypothetical protein
MGRQGMHIEFWKTPLGRPERRLEDKLNVRFKEIGWENLSAWNWVVVVSGRE